MCFLILRFAGSYLCPVERRCSDVLGPQRLLPSTSCFFVVESAVVLEIIVWLTTCYFVQLGDDTQIHRSMPVGAVGLSSGMVMISSGGVNSFAIA